MWKVVTTQFLRTVGRSYGRSGGDENNRRAVAAVMC